MESLKLFICAAIMNGRALTHSFPRIHLKVCSVFAKAKSWKCPHFVFFSLCVVTLEAKHSHNTVSKFRYHHSLSLYSTVASRSSEKSISRYHFCCSSYQVLFKFKKILHPMQLCKISIFLPFLLLFKKKKTLFSKHSKNATIQSSALMAPDIYVNYRLDCYQAFLLVKVRHKVGKNSKHGHNVSDQRWSLLKDFFFF